MTNCLLPSDAEVEQKLPSDAEVEKRSSIFVDHGFDILGDLWMAGIEERPIKRQNLY